MYIKEKASLYSVPAEHAEPTCTNLLSGDTTPLLLNTRLAVAYTEKYKALDGATPTKVGPRPLNNATTPSVCTMCLKHDKIPTGLVTEISTGIPQTPEPVPAGHSTCLKVGTDDCVKKNRCSFVRQSNFYSQHYEH